MQRSDMSSYPRLYEGATTATIASCAPIISLWGGGDMRDVLRGVDVMILCPTAGFKPCLIRMQFRG
ncbi:MAG TPA: hypothetical protein VM166_07085 [Gemmatimonadaceae bacterium]|nr:hypothetical protein [Gemmatimonadaceae bacterium]